MSDYQSLDIWEGGDVTVVRFRGRRIDDFMSIEEVGKDFGRLIEGGKHRRLILDFAGIEYVSSALLGKVISLNAKLQACNGSLKVCNLGPEVLNIFRVCKLDRVLSISADPDEALPMF